MIVSSNWNGSTYSGTLVNTLQGQRYFDNKYIYEAVQDNVWVRYPVSGATGVSASGTSTSQNLQQTLAVGNNSGTYSATINLYQTTVATNSITGAFTQSLTASNIYTYTLTGNTTFGYSNPQTTVYNFAIKAGTYSFSLSVASNWQTVGGTALGFTGSFIMSCIYDGTDMWVSTVKNYLFY